MVWFFRFSPRVTTGAKVFHPEFGTRGADLQTQFRRSSRVLLQWIVSGLTVQWAVSGLIVQRIVSGLIVQWIVSGLTVQWIVSGLIVSG